MPYRFLQVVISFDPVQDAVDETARVGRGKTFAQLDFMGLGVPLKYGVVEGGDAGGEGRLTAGIRVGQRGEPRGVGPQQAPPYVWRRPGVSIAGPFFSNVRKKSTMSPGASGATTQRHRPFSSVIRRFDCGPPFTR